MDIYLDNSATTKPLPRVVETMAEVLSEGFGNPSSGHALGRKAKSALALARTQVASFVCADPERVVFLSGATEANDAVLRAALASGNRAIITTAAEHPSTHGVFASVRERMIVLPLKASGLIDLAQLTEVMKSNPGSLLAMSWVNGETGVIQPIQEICKRAKLYGIETLIDGAQALGRLPQDDFRFGCDYLSLSAHKMNGPKGVGCLVLGENAKCPPLTVGGGQEGGRRSGTENLPGIVGFGVACEERAKTLEADLVRMGAMRDLLEAGLMERVPSVRINGGNSIRVASNSSLLFEGVDGMALVARCDASGVMFSQVSACSTGRPEPSRTLTAMGLSDADAYSSVRFSVSVLTTEDDIRRAIVTVGREAKLILDLMGSAA